ncbi:MAG TPA: DNA methyltransferase [Polyangiaceae bacterium]
MRDRTRRALTQIGGKTEVWGDDRELASLLEFALSVNADSGRGMDHVHGFHSYPARMHPDTAARLVEGLSQNADTVLDPFAGSGTVLVEARLRGRTAWGIDANPLAVELARLKVAGLDRVQSECLGEVANLVIEHAEQRRIGKAGPSRRYPAMLRAAFDPHVLLELDGLLDGIEHESPQELTGVLKLVLSSMINKVSRRQSDTSSAELPRRLASGFVIRFFGKKTQELLARLRQYASALPQHAPPSRIELGDARRLPMRDQTVSAIVTSPPYPGVYDYVEHHRLRLEWLSLDAKHLERHEIGAHRDFSVTHAEGLEGVWAAQLGTCLGEMARVLRQNGLAAILIADTAVAGRPLYANRMILDIAGKHGLHVRAGASQRRQHYHAPTRDVFTAGARCEHLIVLEPDRSKPRPKTALVHRKPRHRTKG